MGDEILKFRLKMLVLMKFDGKYARCNGSACYTSIFNMPVVQLAVQSIRNKNIQETVLSVG